MLSLWGPEILPHHTLYLNQWESLRFSEFSLILRNSHWFKSVSFYCTWDAVNFSVQTAKKIPLTLTSQCQTSLQSCNLNHVCNGVAYTVLNLTCKDHQAKCRLQVGRATWRRRLTAASDVVWWQSGTIAKHRTYYLTCRSFADFWLEKVPLPVK